jgi:hypothetical protein
MPAPTPIPENVLSAFANVSKQGDQFNKRTSDDGWYYAFLSKLDPHYGNDQGKGEPDGLTVTFEIAPRAYIENSVLRANPAIKTMPKNIPASLLHFEKVQEADLRDMLKLKPDDPPLAEGEWHLIKLEKPPQKGLDAVMIDPDLDLTTQGPP